MLDRLTESTDIVRAFEDILTKVFCDECKGYQGLKGKKGDLLCSLDQGTKITWESREQGEASVCKEKNKNNDCKQFEKK